MKFKSVFFSRLVVVGLIFCSILILGIFKEKFKFQEFIIWGSVGGVLLALLMSFIELVFHKKNIVATLSNVPLRSFRDKGFEIEDNNKLVGYVNGYKIFLAPIKKNKNNYTLNVLIPVENSSGIKPGKIKDKLSLITLGNVYFVEALLSDFYKNYTFDQLFSFINKTTAFLDTIGISPLR